MNVSTKRRILYCLLILSIGIFSYGVSGVIYTLVSNHSHASFSFDIGAPIVTKIIPGTSNLTAVNFTLTAFNSKSSSMSNLFINITLDNHPNGTFYLNNIPSINYQWIIYGPFSLSSNQIEAFPFTLNYGGVFGFYDIDATVLQGS